MTAWEERLEEALKTHDLWPWALVTNKTMPIGSVAGAQALLSSQQGYDHFWKDMPFSAWDQWIPGTAGKYSAAQPGFVDISIGAGLYNWQLGAGSGLVQEAQYQVATEDLVGAYNDAWLSLVKGGELPTNVVFNAYWTLGSAYGAINNGGIVTQTLRGYRPYPKGYLNRPQLTRQELLASGKYRLRSYQYAQTVTAMFANGANAPPSPSQGPLSSFAAQFNAPANLACDFLCHRVRFRPQSPIVTVDGSPNEAGIQSWIYSVQVGLQDSDQGLSWQGGQSGNGQTQALNPWTHWVGVDWNQYIAGQAQVPPVFFPPVQRAATQWVLNHPLTIKNNAQYNVMAQCPALPPAAAGPVGFANQYQVTMEVVLDGELIIPK